MSNGRACAMRARSAAGVSDSLQAVTACATSDCSVMARMVTERDQRSWVRGTPTSRYARPRAIRRRAYEERIAGRYARRTVVALDRGRLVAGVEFGGAIKVGAGLADDAVSSRSVSARMGSALDKAVVDGLEGGLLAGRPRPSRLTTMPLKPLLADLGCVRLTDLTVHDVRPAPTTMAAHYPTHTLQKAHNCPTRAIRHAEGHDP